MHACVSDQGFGQFNETIRGEAMGNDKNTVVNAPFVIELERETDKIIAIPGNEAALLQSSAFKLLEVRKSFGPNLVNAHSIESLAAEPFCNSLAQIFIQVIPQERSCCMRTGDGATGDRTYDTNDG
jgi:hypothetical protein